ncbi:MAG: hypothetical protein EZS28_000699 [Streblomastix strix]|uniref:Uncharacterized protein n=1 Tax=Streblomastix strix TaxID=222440 RepID=A0A5J4X939_9EUKA|nr:MAG: hypothetical protein EZS28_000695 [Streblomastix strix]KAA6403778.1 MAG: hypothetical protein EZS28_000699 [Streblomastix strix]
MFNDVTVTDEWDQYLAFAYIGLHYTQVVVPLGTSIAPETFAKTIQILTESAIVEERNAMDSASISYIWISDQGKEDQIDPRTAVHILEMDVQLENNENFVDLRQMERVKESIIEIDKTSYGIKIIKSKRRGKFGWYAQSIKENNSGQSIRGNDSILLARVYFVDISKGNNSKREGIGRGREGVGDEIEDEEDKPESSSQEDIGFRGKRGQDGAKLFRNALGVSRLSRSAIRTIIDNWHVSWKRHVCALSAFWENMRRRGMREEQFTRIEKPYIIIAEKSLKSITKINSQSRFSGGRR